MIGGRTDAAHGAKAGARRALVSGLGIVAGLSLVAAAVLVVTPVVGSHPASVAAAAGDPVLVVAGDIACGATDPDFSGSNSGRLPAAGHGRPHRRHPAQLPAPRRRHPVRRHRDRGGPTHRHRLHRRLRRELGAAAEPVQPGLRPGPGGAAHPRRQRVRGRQRDRLGGGGQRLELLLVLLEPGRPPCGRHRAVERLLQLRHPRERGNHLARHLARQRVRGAAGDAGRACPRRARRAVRRGRPRRRSYATTWPRTRENARSSTSTSPSSPRASEPTPTTRPSGTTPSSTT